MRKVIFLDRDGTLIVDKIYLNDPSAIEYLPGVFQGLRALRDCGFQFIVATNQSGVPRGLVSLKNLHEIHRRIRGEMSRQGIDFLQFYYAPFLTDDRHPMRKPNPGMLNCGVRDFNVDKVHSWMIGDRMTDVEAGRRAGMDSVFLKGTEDPHLSPYLSADFVANDFLEAVDFIVYRSQSSN